MIQGARRDAPLPAEKETLCNPACWRRLDEFFGITFTSTLSSAPAATISQFGKLNQKPRTSLDNIPRATTQFSFLRFLSLYTPSCAASSPSSGWSWTLCVILRLMARATSLIDFFLSTLVSLGFK